MASSSLTSLLFFSLLSFSSAQTTTKAAAILSDAGYNSMSFSLDLVSHSLPSPPPSLTVFAPPDDAFTSSDSGEPTLDLLRLHLLPAAFPLRSLKSLPFGAKIATLLAGQYLTVTTFPAVDGGLVSLNNVTVTASPIFDDGSSLVIFGTNAFFGLDFWISGPTRSRSPEILGCSVPPRNPRGGGTAFGEASRAMRLNGCSVMASFLEMQFRGFQTFPAMLTVFAPVDQAMANRTGDLNQFSSILRRHVAPCRLSWSDLVSLDGGAELRTILRAFTVKVSRSDGVLVLNGVQVTLPEMYRNEWLVVHGISEVLESLPEQVVVAASPDSEVVGNSSSGADQVIKVPSSSEFDSGDYSEEFDGGDWELFANMTEDDDAVSHRRFFVYRPS